MDSPKKFTDEELLLTPIQDKEHMQLFLNKFLGFTLPDKIVTEWANGTPLDFVWEAYRAIMDGKSLHMIGLSGRGSGKTLAISVVDLLSILHNHRSAMHAAVTKDQAQRARDYFDNYVKRIEFLQRAKGKDKNRRKISFNIAGNDVCLEVISMTKDQAQGGHFALLSVDELSSAVNPSEQKAYKDLSGVPVSFVKKDGTTAPAVILKITSRQAGDSVVEKEMKKSEELGIKVMIWTSIDSMQKCEPERHGDRPSPMYVDILRDKMLHPDEWKVLPQLEQEKYKYAPDLMSGCLTCPLSRICQGKARFQTSTSPILSRIDDVIYKYRSGGHDWALSQLLSLKANPEGLVYIHFNRDKHVPGWDAMWEKLTGQAPTKPVTRQQFVEKAKKICSWKCSEDFGWSNPSTCVVAAIDRRDNIYIIDAFGETFKDDPEWTEIVKRRAQERYPIEFHVPDPENKSALSLFRKAEMSVMEVDKSAGSIRAGINVVKSFLKVPGTNDETKFFIAPDLVSPPDAKFKGIIEEFEAYRWPLAADGTILDDKNPEKGNDHFLDAVRYLLYYLYGKSASTLSFLDGSESDPSDPRDKLLKQASQIGGFSYIDNRNDPKPEDDDPDGSDDNPNGPGGGSGGFHWSW